jgi:tRNA threonylcarbamoyladenosine biosynthesis protein TsaB
MDTCDARGSVALLRDGETVSQESHDTTEEYSSWLIPACNKLLGPYELIPSKVDGYVVAAGPGSFTGVRVGLTTVKAWAEVSQRPIVAVSRLAAIAFEVFSSGNLVASFVDAHRGQIFGSLYQSNSGALNRIQDELVISPAGFVNWVEQQAGNARVSWASPDPDVLDPLEGFKRRLQGGDFVHTVRFPLAPVIGQMGVSQFELGQCTDSLHLDANYVRRSDAEIFWKSATQLARV